MESLYSDVGGPEKVSVQLKSKEETRSTVTDKDGNFFFTPVFPGTYIVSIEHPRWVFILSSLCFIFGEYCRWKILKKSVEVQVAESNAELVKSSLVIQGYDVKGNVKSDNEPVKGVTIVLFSKEEVNVLNCNV